MIKLIAHCKKEFNINNPYAVNRSPAPSIFSVLPADPGYIPDPAKLNDAGEEFENGEGEENKRMFEIFDHHNE